MEQRTFFQRLRRLYTLVYVESRHQPGHRQPTVTGIPGIGLELTLVLAAAIIAIGHLVT